MQHERLEKDTREYTASGSTTQRWKDWYGYVAIVAKQQRRWTKSGPGGDVQRVLNLCRAVFWGNEWSDNPIKIVDTYLKRAGSVSPARTGAALLVLDLPRGVGAYDWMTYDQYESEVSIVPARSFQSDRGPIAFSLLESNGK